MTNSNTGTMARYKTGMGYVDGLAHGYEKGLLEGAADIAAAPSLFERNQAELTGKIIESQKPKSMVGTAIMAIGCATEYHMDAGITKPTWQEVVGMALESLDAAGLMQEVNQMNLNTLVDTYREHLLFASSLAMAEGGTVFFQSMKESESPDLKEVETWEEWKSHFNEKRMTYAATAIGKSVLGFLKLYANFIIERDAAIED